MKHSKYGTAGTPEHMAWLKTQLPELQETRDTIMTKDQLRELIADFSPDDLRTLRAIINGKLSRRTITPEQQKKMQDARKK